jgi:hypothetical protein
LLTGAGRTLDGRLLLVDALSAQVRALSVRRDPECNTCAKGRKAEVREQQ